MRRGTQSVFWTLPAVRDDRLLDPLWLSLEMAQKIGSPVFGVLA
jgi:hypothetical protein